MVDREKQRLENKLLKNRLKGTLLFISHDPISKVKHDDPYKYNYATATSEKRQRRKERCRKEGITMKQLRRIESKENRLKQAQERAQRVSKA